MLALKKRKKRRIIPILIISLATLSLLSGLYLLSLVTAPTIAPYIGIARKPIDTAKLPAPQAEDQHIIISKIGVNIPFAPGNVALDRGAEWRFPSRGNPETGGNFIIAAHRLSIQPTPQGTIEKSPFYDIDKLMTGDQILIDYKGQRYAYTIEKIYDIKPTQVEIEAPSDTPKLTLYTCTLGGASDGRVVLEAKPTGIVKV